MMRTISSCLLLLVALDGACGFTTTSSRRASSVATSSSTGHPSLSTAVAAASSSNTCLSVTRRNALLATTTASFLLLLPNPAIAKCTDIDSCRELGDAKDQLDLEQHPIHRLDNGVSYKILDPGTTTIATNTGSTADSVVSPTSSVDIAFSVSQANGRYMYSKGFGLEKIKVMGKLVPDLHLDSLRVTLGRHDVPIGVEQVLVGMKKGEKRRVVLPPQVGFDSSDWQPAPTKRDAQRQLQVYRQLLEGNGDTQPPLAVPTVWDVQVLRIRS